MKKILISIMIIAVVAAIAVGGTIAYFSDTFTVNDNYVKAGTFSVSNGGGTMPINIVGMMPGDTATYYFAVYNDGDAPAWVHAYVTNIRNSRQLADNILATVTVESSNPGGFPVFPGGGPWPNYTGPLSTYNSDNYWDPDSGPNAMPKGSMGYYKIVLLFNPNAGNALQGADVYLDLQVDAVQSAQVPPGWSAPGN